MLVWIISIVFVVIILSYRAFIKLKHPFWSRMPVVHSYGISRFATRSGYIEDGGPKIDKWWDPSMVSVLQFGNSTTEDKVAFCSFIREHYLDLDQVKFKPPDGRLLPYFSVDSTACYLSFLSDKKSGMPGDERLAGVLSTRPLTLFLPDRTLTTHYCDFLCIHPDFREKGLSPYLIQTQTHKARSDHAKIQACLFKRENNSEMCIVPLVEYVVVLFDCKEWTLDLKYKKRADIVHLEKENFFQIRELFKSDIRKKFGYFIAPSIDQLLNLMQSRIYHVFALVVEDRISALYFFRDGSTTMKGNRVAEFISSVDLGCEDSDEFVFGFLKAYNVLKMEFPSVSIDCVSHNQVVVDYLASRYDPVARTKSAFYLYNYSYPTGRDNDCFILD